MRRQIVVKNFLAYAVAVAQFLFRRSRELRARILDLVLVLLTKDLVFQIFRINHEKLKEYQQMFLNRVDQYYALVNK